MPMITDIRPTMTTDPKLLTLVHWLSPAFPIGSFAWSHGLEAAIADGWIKDADGLHDWLADLIHHGSLRNDAALVILAHAAPDLTGIKDLNADAQALAASGERLAEGTRQGAAFAKLVRDVWGLDVPDLMLPVTIGWAAKQADLDVTDVVAVFAQNTLANLVAAAQRLMPLGQSDAQRILAQLTPAVAALPDQVADLGVGDMISNTFASDIAAMRHETLQPRMFQS